MKILSGLFITFISISVVFSFSGCSLGGAKSDNKTDQKKLSTTKTISVATDSSYKDKITLELEKAGFSIVPQNQSKFQIEAVVGNEIDWCQRKNSRKFESVVYKLKDLKNQKTLFILEKDGWSSKCEIYQTSVFTKLAKMISERWESPEGEWFYSDYIYF